MKKLSLILLLLIMGCAARTAQLCPTEDAIFLNPFGQLSVIPKDFFNWQNDQGGKYWIPLEKYLEIQKKQDGL